MLEKAPVAELALFKWNLQSASAALKMYYYFVNKLLMCVKKI